MSSVVCVAPDLVVCYAAFAEASSQRLPMMRQQGADLLRGMRRNAAQHISKPDLRIHIMPPARIQKRVEHRRPLGCRMGSHKQVVLTPESDGADSVFDQIIVPFNLAGSGVPDKPLPTRQRVEHDLSPWTLR